MQAYLLSLEGSLTQDFIILSGLTGGLEMSVTPETIFNRINIKPFFLKIPHPDWIFYTAGHNHANKTDLW